MPLEAYFFVLLIRFWEVIGEFWHSIATFFPSCNSKYTSVTWSSKLNGEFDGKYYKLFFNSINGKNLLVLSSLVEFPSGSHIFIDSEDCGRPYHLERRINSIVDC